MNNKETLVSQHYGDETLLERILTGLKTSGIDLDRLQPEDHTPVEEFHIGRRKATLMW